MWRTAGYSVWTTKNKDLMKELNTEPIINFMQALSVVGNGTLLGCLIQEFGFKWYVINRKEMIHRQALEAAQ
jgi:hypothetical protein